MTETLVQTPADKSMGNWRSMTNMADQLFLEGMKRNLVQLDEALDFSQR